MVWYRFVQFFVECWEVVRSTCDFCGDMYSIRMKNRVWLELVHDSRYMQETKSIWREAECDTYIRIQVTYASTLLSRFLRPFELHVLMWSSLFLRIRRYEL